MRHACVGLVAWLLLTGVALAEDGLRTPNFLIHAPNREVAQLVAKHAEAERKAQAKTWLGHEMAPWRVPCVVHVKVTVGGSKGWTATRYEGGKVFTHDMEINADVERIPSVLAHEVTHTVFAHALGQPVPRWADEGAAVLSEDRVARARQDAIFSRVLAQRSRWIPLRRLFKMKAYPEDMDGFYAEGYSLTRYLLERKDRPTFLAFVKSGAADGWDAALRKHYHILRVEDLEKAWLRVERKKGEQGPRSKTAVPER
jgi:hypothetical protein